MSQVVTEDIVGYPVCTLNKGACVDKIADWIGEGRGPKYFVCANPHSIQMAEQEPMFKLALLGADLITPDGIGVVLASKILGGNIRDRVTGSDIFWGLSETMSLAGDVSYFFLGSTEEALSQIRRKMASDFPGIKVVGTYSPPFKAEFTEEDNRKMIEAVNDRKPDVLWVGMTAPKQEKWIYAHKGDLDVKFIGAIGAVFDFFGGKIKRSHPAFQRLGLEWLPRLLQEPRRLWRRNFMSNPQFMIRVLRTKFRELSAE